MQKEIYDKKQSITEVWVFRREFNSYYNPFLGYKTKDEFAEHLILAESVFYDTDKIILALTKTVEPLRTEVWEINTPYVGYYGDIVGKQRLSETDIFMSKDNYDNYKSANGVYVLKNERTRAYDLQTLVFYKNVDKFKFGAKEIRY